MRRFAQLARGGARYLWDDTSQTLWLLDFEAKTMRELDCSLQMLFKQGYVEIDAQWDELPGWNQLLRADHASGEENK